MTKIFDTPSPPGHFFDSVRDRGNRVVAKWAIGLRTTIATKTYFVSWKVPRGVAKTGLKFCLAAYDPSGNHTPPRCSPVHVKG
jgi:hypothetical protein